MQCYSSFAGQKWGIPLQHAKHARHILIDFCTKFTGKIKSILKLAMLVNFQLNFSTKFTGKIKSIWKLAMLCMFCEPETESPTPACKTCRSHFIGTKFTEKIISILSMRCRSNLNWFLAQNLLLNQSILTFCFKKDTEKMGIFFPKLDYCTISSYLICEKISY